MLGFQPELDEHYKSAKIVIVPLIDGAGLKGKLAEALSYGVPTVTTSIGAEGFKPGNNGQFPFVVSDDPLDFARQIVRISAESVRAEEFSVASLEYVQDKLSESAVDIAIDGILSQFSTK
jgi:glycosyltransferase involved in cell wall biosynthesis